MAVVSILRRRLISTASDTTYGIVLFRMFDMLDVYGPSDILQLIGGSHQTNIVYIAEALESVTTRPGKGGDESTKLLSISISYAHTHVRDSTGPGRSHYPWRVGMAQPDKFERYYGIHPQNYTQNTAGSHHMHRVSSRGLC